MQGTWFQRKVGTNDDTDPEHKLARIDHQRPSLRYSDNQAKVLRELARDLMLTSDASAPKRATSPPAPEASRPAISAYFAAVDAEMTAFSNAIDATLKSSKARKAASAKLAEARAHRDTACDAVVVGLYTLETADERRALGRWLRWLAKELPSLAEESLVPSLQRISALVDSLRE